MCCAFDRRGSCIDSFQRMLNEAESPYLQTSSKAFRASKSSKKAFMLLREERGLSGEERGDWKGERRTNEKMTGSGDEEEGGWGWG